MQTYRKVTNSKDSLQMTLVHSRLLPEVTWQILWQLYKPPSTQLVPLPGRKSLPLATSLPSFRKPEQSWETVNGAKAHNPAEGEGIIPGMRKQLGLVNPEAIRADSPEFICQRGLTWSSSWQNSLYLYNTQQSCDPAQSCWTLQQCKQ